MNDDLLKRLSAGACDMQAARAEIIRLRARLADAERDLQDITIIAENFTDLATCAATGRTINHPSSGYVCFLCGADRAAGQRCMAVRK